MKTQIAREIYLKTIYVMKKTLDLIEFKFDKRTKEFKYFKSQLMDNTYEGLQKLFKTLSDAKFIQKCSCGTNIRKGFRNCDCGGSGYINFKEK